MEGPTMSVRTILQAAIPLLLLVSPVLVAAQQPPGMDPAEMMRRFQDPAAMQRMAAEAEATQQCIAGIDQAKIEALQARGEAAAKEIETLCAAGKKKEALSRALEMSSEMRADPTVQKLRECTKGMTEMMRSMPWAQLPGVADEPDPTDRDICS